MKALIIGKAGGTWTNKDGKNVESYKIYFLIPFNDSKREGYHHVGYIPYERRTDFLTFSSLPDGKDTDYEVGIPCNVSFDINGQISELVLE